MFGFGAQSSVKTLTPTQVRQMGDTVTLVDVRENAEWASGHIAGAIHIPLGRLREEMNLIPSDKPVVGTVRPAAVHRKRLPLPRLLDSRTTATWAAASALGMRKGFHWQAESASVFATEV